MFKGEVSDQASHAMRDLQGEGTFYLTASTDIQVAEEKEGDEYSLLTKYLIQGIREGTADSDDDGKVSFQELCSFVQKRVAPEGKQRPKVWALDTAGQVIVALTGKPASDTRRKAVTKKLYDLAAQGFLTDEIVGDLLAVVNRSSSSYIAPGLGVKELIDSLYSKSENTGEFVKEVFQRIHQLKEPHAIISRTPSKKTGEVEKEQTHLTFKLMAIVVSGVVLLLIVFGLFSTLNKKTGQEAENMIIKCDPECSTDTNFALSVSSAGPKNLRGRVQLAALLPQPTALKCWRLTVDGNSIDSGTGVKDFTSGDVFEDFNIRGIHPLGFNIFHRLSGDVLGISVSSYNVFAFTLLENSNTGAFSIQPITFSQFNRTKSCETESPEGAKGFPTGTMFFAFMVDGTQVVNQTPLNAIVVVR
jgi:hypothetical protein